MRKIGLDPELDYKNVPNKDGWVDANQFMPADFDLCYLKVDNNKSKMGWASGFIWDGLRIRAKEKVLFWKKQIEQRERVTRCHL